MPGPGRMCYSGPRSEFWAFYLSQRFSNCGFSECEINLVGQDQHLKKTLKLSRTELNRKRSELIS